MYAEAYPNKKPSGTEKGTLEKKVNQICVELRKNLENSPKRFDYFTSTLSTHMKMHPPEVDIALEKIKALRGMLEMFCTKFRSLGVELT